MSFTIALAQINPTVGDIDGNLARIRAARDRAAAGGADIVVLPELALTGYTCADLFQHVPLQRGAVEALLHVAKQGGGVFSGIAVVGLPLVVDDQAPEGHVCTPGANLGTRTITFVPDPGAVSTTRP